MKDLPLIDNSLEQVFGQSTFATPAVSIRIEDTLSEAAILLPHHLESLTDSLVATRNEQPVGVLGGIEVLDGILTNPTAKFLEGTMIGDIMNRNIVIMNSDRKVSDLIKKWLQTRRAFAIVPNQFHGFSVISARKMLEVGTSFRINATLSSIPKNKIATFSKEENVEQIITRMFERRSRKLVLEGTTYFINDRIIIQKLTRELNCLRNGEDFLNIKADTFELEKAKIVSEDISISEGCKIMQTMTSPFLIVNDRVVSPWDIVVFLASKQG